MKNKPICKSLKNLKDKMIFINSPKSYFEDYGQLKDLLNGKRITVDDLHNESQKNLVMAMYIHLVRINGKVRWHDWFIKTVLIVGIVGGAITYFLFGG